MMKTKGKNYANRKPEHLRPNEDFYPTPSCMVEELINSQVSIFNECVEGKIIYDPCCGKYAIGNVLRKKGFTDYNRLIETDLIYGNDYLEKDDDGNYVNLNHYDIIIMNPPFKKFDDFVGKAKIQADKVFCIGKPNFFGAHNRNVNGLWEHLEYVLIFDRMIAFDKPETEDGKVECGMLVSCWFIWDKDYNGLPQIKVLDMQKYIAKKN